MSNEFSPDAGRPMWERVAIVIMYMNAVYQHPGIFLPLLGIIGVNITFAAINRAFLEVAFSVLREARTKEARGEFNIVELTDSIGASLATIVLILLRVFLLFGSAYYAFRHPGAASDPIMCAIYGLGAATFASAWGNIYLVPSPEAIQRQRDALPGSDQ